MPPKKVKGSTGESNSLQIRDDQYDKCEKMLTLYLELVDIMDWNSVLHMEAHQFRFIKTHIMNNDYPEALCFSAKYILRLIRDTMAEVFNLEGQADWSVSCTPLERRVSMLQAKLPLIGASLDDAVTKAIGIVQTGQPAEDGVKDLAKFPKDLKLALSPGLLLIVGYTLGFQRWPNSDSYVYVAKSYNIMRFCESTLFQLVDSMKLEDKFTTPFVAFDNRRKSPDEPDNIRGGGEAAADAAAAAGGDISEEEDEDDGGEAGGRPTEEGKSSYMKNLLRSCIFKKWYDCCIDTQVFNASMLSGTHLQKGIDLFNENVRNHWRQSLGLNELPSDFGVKYCTPKADNWLKNMNQKTKSFVEEIPDKEPISVSLAADLIVSKRRIALERFWQFHIMRIKLSIGGKKRVREEEGSSQSAASRRGRALRIDNLMATAGGDNNTNNGLFSSQPLQAIASQVIDLTEEIRKDKEELLALRHQAFAMTAENNSLQRQILDSIGHLTRVMYASLAATTSTTSRTTSVSSSSPAADMLPAVLFGGGSSSLLAPPPPPSSSSSSSGNNHLVPAGGVGALMFSSPTSHPTTSSSSTTTSSSKKNKSSREEEE